MDGYFPCYFSLMTEFSPDATDWHLLDVLQRDGRISFAELARARGALVLVRRQRV